MVVGSHFDISSAHAVSFEYGSLGEAIRVFAQLNQIRKVVEDGGDIFNPHSLGCSE